MENETEKIINETIEKNKIFGVVYTVDGLEYCDWLQPSEISVNVLADENIIIQWFIIQYNETKIKVLPTKTIIDKIQNI